jgi:O-antigen/teichoic acid export membrane protein
VSTHATARAWRVTVRRFVGLFAGESLARALGLVTLLVQARALSPSGLGIVSVALALIIWLALVADAGTEMLSTRDVASDPTRFRHIAEAVLGLRLLISGSTALALAVGAVLFAESDTTRDVYVVFALVLPVMALNIRWISVGAAGARPLMVGNVGGAAVLLLGTVLFVTGPEDVTVVPALYVLSELVFAGLVAALLAPRFGLLRPRLDGALWRSRLAGGLPLMVGTLARGSFGVVDLVVVGAALGAAEAGEYSAGLRPVLFLITAVGLYFYSFVVSYTGLDAGQRTAFVRLSVRTALVVSIPIAVVLTVTAEPIVRLLFGSDYEEGAIVLAILAWRLPASALGATFSGVLLAQRRQASLMWVYIAGALVGAALVVLGTTGGIAGVAAASVVASWLVTVLLIRSSTAGRVRT